MGVDSKVVVLQLEPATWGKIAKTFGVEASPVAYGTTQTANVYVFKGIAV